MKILVTGGAGFIGSHLVDKLIEKKHKVIVVDNLSTGRKENLNTKVKFCKIDICSPKISQIFKREKPEIIFHYAAQVDVQKSVKDPISNAKINILGTLNLLENSREFGVKKFIFASTGGAIYGDAEIIPTPENCSSRPISPYGVTKLTAEKYLNYYYETFGLSYISLRLANVYGPRQKAGVIPIFIDKMFKNEKIVINGDGEQTRDFVFIQDVIEANILALEKDKIGVFNVGTGKEASINEIFQKLKETIKTKTIAEYGEEKAGDIKRSCLDFFKIEKILNWESKHNLDQGLKKTIDWVKKE